MNRADLLAFGHLIKGLREKKGGTQAELAERIGVSAPYISQVELGRRIPVDALCIKLAEALDYDVRDLVSRARKARSPETETTLSRYNAHQRKRREGATDPRLQDLEEQLRRLKAILPTERYERLLDTIQGVLEPYLAHVARTSKRKT
jgi:transcriptional regulator with XRE-family HTH domain